jgi:hypothetical protein
MELSSRIEAAIRGARNQGTFLNGLLAQTLGWPIAEGMEKVEDISYGWSKDELRANDLDEKIVDGQIWQIQPLHAKQPWGIFLLEFKNPEVFTTGRGITGPLRKVLRGLEPSRRREAHLAAWKRENLLFICTHDYKHFRFAYFKALEGGLKSSPLATFGWGPDIPARTACEFNLPALAWPANTEPDKWISAWSSAFDVAKVTKHFYEDYADLFEHVEGIISKASGLKNEELRMFTQTLLNRLMFLRFIERKGWLKFDGHRDYLRVLHAAGPIGGKSFYQSRLHPLFFQGMALEKHSSHAAIGDVPFLNGGLFEETDLDSKVDDIPDKAFELIIGDRGLFYRYNFTVEESTPLDIEVAVDPEMLGKVFEELVTGRHETGSYYTPRPIVSFMCREALKGYLAGKTKSAPDAIAALVDDHEVKGLTETNAREILDALDNVKAVDPACGSGAYLLGLLQELVFIYRSLYSEKLVKDFRSLYDLKLRIICNNLYGVDIDPFATNIAMLRLWLSLAVEADEPMPLPNLDFKIETGDALLSYNPQDISDLFRDVMRKKAETLVSLKGEYLKAHGKDKAGSKAEIEKVEKELAANIEYHVKPGSVDWRIQFAEVFAKNGGFDIALANPPYISHDQITADKDILRRFYSTYSAFGDLYCYFLERALQLLRSGGTMAFITSNSYLKAKYGSELRTLLQKKARIRQLLNIEVSQVFLAAIVNVAILVAQKRGVGESDTDSARVCNSSWDGCNFADFLRGHSYDIPLDHFTSTQWSLEKPEVLSIRAKIEKGGHTLKWLGTKIRLGVATGCNEAFLINSAKREELIARHANSADIIVPVIRGRDVERYGNVKPSLYLIAAKNGVNVKRDYPAVYEHLNSFGESFRKRGAQGENWWNLRACAFYDDFDRERIVWMELTDRARFTVCDAGVWCLNTTYFLLPPNEYPITYLLAILNSNVIYFYFKLVAQTSGMGVPRWINIYVEQFPIPYGPKEVRGVLEQLVQHIILQKQRNADADTVALEREIDQHVYKLYNLTPEEIRIVENYTRPK